MDATSLANLAAYSAQVVCVAALGTLVAALLPVNAASVRYGFWRGLLALSVLLPFVQVHREPPAAAGQAGAAAVAEGMPEIAMSMTTTAGGGADVDWLFVAGIVLAAGVAFRLLWLAASLISLRRMRTLGTPLGQSGLADELQVALNTRADIRYVDGLRQPVTFGSLRPVVLLPAALRAHPEEIQRAVLCHELLHVQRRDWLWVLGEEALRAVLWFNPAVWWLIARVQLAREEVVDELAVLATNGRKAYMEALLAFADETPLAPAAAFARRRHLFRRMVLLSKEEVMSSKRIVFSSVVMAVTMIGGTWYVVHAFPLTVKSIQAVQLLSEPGPLEKQAKAVTAENPVPRRVSHANSIIPADMEVIGMTGIVTFHITLDSVGRVAEARRTRVVFRSSTPDIRGEIVADPVRQIETVLEKHAPEHRAALLAGFRALETAAFDALRQWRYEPPFEAPLSFAVSVPVGAQPATGSAVAAPTPGGSIQAEGALRVGGEVKPPTKIRDVRPVYPDVARQARVQGVVILEVLIGTDGSVQDARVLRSIPLLDEAAMDAVRQWRFTPTLVNGVATPVIMTVTVNFTMQ